MRCLKKKTGGARQNSLNLKPEPAQEEEQTEELTDNIWHRLGESWRLHARLGEETLTDLLILDFLPSALRYSEVFS